MATRIDPVNSKMMFDAQQIQKKKAAMEAEMKAVRISTHVSIAEFSKLYFKHEHVHLDLVIELKDAKFKLKQATLRQKLSKIESEMRAFREEEDDADMFEQMHGEDIGIPSHDDHQMVAALKAFEKDAQMMMKCYGFTSNSLVVQIPSVTSLVCDEIERLEFI